MSTLLRADASTCQGNPARKTGTASPSPKKGKHTPRLPELPDAGWGDGRKGEVLTVWVYVLTEFCLGLTVGSVTGLV